MTVHRSFCWLLTTVLFLLAAKPSQAEELPERQITITMAPSCAIKVPVSLYSFATSLAAVLAIGPTAEARPKVAVSRFLPPVGPAARLSTIDINRSTGQDLLAEFFMVAFCRSWMARCPTMAVRASQGPSVRRSGPRCRLGSTDMLRVLKGARADAKPPGVLQVERASPQTRPGSCPEKDRSRLAHENH